MGSGVVGRDETQLMGLLGIGLEQWEKGLRSHLRERTRSRFKNVWEGGICPAAWIQFPGAPFTVHSLCKSFKLLRLSFFSV